MNGVKEVQRALTDAMRRGVAARLLMEEILNNHLRCTNPANNGINYLSTGAGFLLLPRCMMCSFWCLWHLNISDVYIYRSRISTIPDDYPVESTRPWGNQVVVYWVGKIKLLSVSWPPAFLKNSKWQFPRFCLTQQLTMKSTETSHLHFIPYPTSPKRKSQSQPPQESGWSFPLETKNPQVSRVSLWVYHDFRKKNEEKSESKGGKLNSSDPSDPLESLEVITAWSMPAPSAASPAERTRQVPVLRKWRLQGPCQLRWERKRLAAKNTSEDGGFWMGM